MIDRVAVFEKFNGKCGYSGTKLESDWQVDHLFPKRCGHFYESDVMRNYHNFKGSCVDSIDNLMPSQKIINHYKGGLFLEEFRDWYLAGLHKRIAKLPKNPRTERSIKKKIYLLKVAGYFGITKYNPFSGKFYFETINRK